jgi:AraC-like DNA-binding protein
MISEISNSTGYCNVQAMSKAFKMKYGVTPSEYRKEKMDYKKVF